MLAAHHSLNAAVHFPGDAEGPEASTVTDAVRVENEDVTARELGTTTCLVCVRNKAATVQEAPMTRGLIEVTKIKNLGGHRCDRNQSSALQGGDRDHRRGSNRRRIHVRRFT
ncbi:hypothetical protein PoB_004527200 [Plakobranchus ocellatus]|uniref:Uncharacterized protein n=1 Tax=Plakobranchus ocellatus TaxID=259542 RepID=A0AAV4BIJ4_9GAST|nr:hypothetical protein PoB_004527200 [Plakobranchus ocellatus]